MILRDGFLEHPEDLHIDLVGDGTVWQAFVGMRRVDGKVVYVETGIITPDLATGLAMVMVPITMLYPNIIPTASYIDKDGTEHPIDFNNFQRPTTLTVAEEIE